MFRRLVGVVAFLLAASALSAQIGENFEKGGIAVYGSGRFRVDSYHFLDSSDESQFIEVELGPGLEFYPRDRMAVWVEVDFYYYDHTGATGDVSKYMSMGAATGVAWYFLRDPAASTGVVWSAGIGGGLYRYRDLDDKVAGVTDVDNTAYTDLRVYGALRAYYFVTPRVAFYVRLSPMLRYTLAYDDDLGKALDLELDERLGLNTNFYLGVSWWLPTRDRVLPGAR